MKYTLLTFLLILIFQTMTYAQQYEYIEFSALSDWHLSQLDAINEAYANAASLAAQAVGTTVESLLSVATSSETSYDVETYQEVVQAITLRSIPTNLRIFQDGDPDIMERNGQYSARVRIKVPKQDINQLATHMRYTITDYISQGFYKEALVTLQLLIVLDQSELNPYEDIIDMQDRLEMFDDAISNLDKLVSDVKERNDRNLIDRLPDIAQRLKGRIGDRPSYIARVDTVMERISGIKKSIGVAIGLSVLFPGAGQIYAESYIKGSIFMALGAGLLTSGIVTIAISHSYLTKRDNPTNNNSEIDYWDNKYKTYWYTGIVLISVYGAFWIYNWFDAWFTADAFNETGGIDIAYVPALNFGYEARPLGIAFGIKNNSYQLMYTIRW